MVGSRDEMEVAPSVSGWLLIGLKTVPPVIALALHLEVVSPVTRLHGTIADLEEAI